jgi:ethanolamine transporter
MRRRGTTRRLAATLLWSELRGLGWKLFVFPVGIGLLFLSVFLLPADAIGTLDPETMEILRMQADRYFADVESDRGLILALFFVQGPFFIAMTSAILSLLLVQTGVGKRLQDGELELLLSGPYSPNQVFLALIGGSVALTLLAVASLAVIALGGGLLVLVSSGVELGGGLLTLLILAVVLPIPLAMWATLVAVVVYLRWPETTSNGAGPGNFVILLGVLPSIIAVIGINAVPSLDPVVGALGLLVVTTAAIGIGAVSLKRWLRVDRLL